MTGGPVESGYVLGDHRQLELRGSRLLHIASLRVTPDHLIARLRNVSPQTRVHVLASELEPAFDAFDLFSKVRPPEPVRSHRAKSVALYSAERRIGDELRYILDRKYADKFAGNMLPRPELLLNPWEVRDTRTGVEDLSADDALADAEPESRTRRLSQNTAELQVSIETSEASLDCLENSSVVLPNLKPDAQGRVTIDRARLTGKPYVRLVAVDLRSTAQRSVVLPPAETQMLDLRLRHGLDPGKPYSQQKQVHAMESDQTFALRDIRTGRFQLYDSLTQVYQLYETLTADPHLRQFRFILRWPEMAEEEKRKLYSEFACHELNFFLSRKDQAFFQDSVVPHLRQKLGKTFFDHYLLRSNLSAYLEPWNYQQLNVVERILLAQRMPQERQITADHLSQLWNLIPPDSERFDRLFDTALLGQALETDSGVTNARLPRRGSLTRLWARPESTSARTRGLGRDLDRGRRFGATVEYAETEESLREMKKSESVEFDADIAVGTVNNWMALPREFAGTRIRKRGEQARFYQSLEQTKEWVENNYYRLPIARQNAELVSINTFWLDLARQPPGEPFRSPHLAEASRNFTEMLLALAVLDLPPKSPSHKITVAEDSVTVKLAGPAVVFHQQVRDTSTMHGESPFLVSQNFFRLDDRYQLVANERVDKFVTDEFLTHTVYGARVVVTNPTSATATLDLLLQIPEGAIPVTDGHYTRNVHLTLEPFHTESTEYFFYFPTTGRFQHYPVHVTRGVSLVAQAAEQTFRVVDTLTSIDRKSWEYLSQSGSDKTGLGLLEDHESPSDRSRTNCVPHARA